MSRRSSFLTTVCLGVASATWIQAQGASRTSLTLAAGVQFHGDWTGSSFGPTAAIALGTRISSNLEVHGVASGSLPIGNSTVYSCAPGQCTAQPSGPGSALGAAAEVVLYTSPRQTGAYLLGGFGAMRYSGRDLDPRTNAQTTLGIGRALGSRRSQFVLEARLVHVFAPAAYPHWLAPIRIGWRRHL